MNDTSTPLIPKVGMSGLFAASAPYDKLLSSVSVYTCTAVTTMSSLVADGLDPYKYVYQKNGDSKENYDNDLAQGVLLVTLQAGAGEFVRIPANRLATLPITDGVVYVNMFLGISLSAVPETIDLRLLRESITDLVYEHLGVRSEVYSTVVGTPAILSHERHRDIEAARNNRTQNNLSLNAKIEVLREENTQLKNKLNVLEAYITKQLSA